MAAWARLRIVLYALIVITSILVIGGLISPLVLVVCWLALATEDWVAPQRASLRVDGTVAAPLAEEEGPLLA